MFLEKPMVDNSCMGNGVHYCLNNSILQDLSRDRRVHSAPSPLSSLKTILIFS